MVSIMSLWLPILLSALFVWIASAVVWTVMPHRKNEFKQLPDEEGARKALKAEVGEYFVPWGSQAAMKDPEYRRKYQEGPVAIVRVIPSGKPAMGRAMALSILSYIVIGIFVAYITSRTLDPGAEYLAVHRVAGVFAFAAYFFAAVPDAIWFGKRWSSTGKLLIEALVYASLTGGTFGWLWPA
jgi:hypothetical protein